MGSVIAIIIVSIVAFAGVVIATTGIKSWAATEKARHESNGAISEDLAEELKAELVEIKENLASINKLLREVQ